MKLMLLIVALATSGCQHASPRGSLSRPEISEERAVELAKAKFSELYPGRLIYYTISASDRLTPGSWYVLFTGTGPYALPGGYTPITVNKSTGEVTVLHSD